MAGESNMGNKSLIWIWAAGAVLCAVYGILEKNYIWFASAALCAVNTVRWYRRYYK